MIRFARTSCPEQFDAFDEQGQAMVVSRQLHKAAGADEFGNAVVLNNMSPDFALED